ncbi:MAG TPA: hypothetical protein VFA10_29145 [Ktedonobacteraceae bacterium]|nr:hypothetical protein [Ktedonobacteraceae bacterium]
MVNHKLLRLSATLSFIGLVVYSVASLLHADGGPTYQATFASYAASADWAAVHLGEFVGMATLLAGLIALFFALNVSQGAPRWLGFFGAIAAGVTLALEGVVYIVDGVALKQAVDAWASAPTAEQATRFASALAIRWLEWGANSYSNIMLGLTMVLFALTIVWTARVTRPIGYLMGLSGLAFIVVGWIVGTEGFGPHAVPMDAGALFLSAWIIWLLVVAWRRKEAVEVVPA